MFWNGTITFKGTASNTYPLTITTPPQVTHPEIKGETYAIPGRDGELISNDTYKGNAEIRVSFAMVAADSVNTSNSYAQKFRAVREWLSGTGKLIIGDSTDSYYEVLKTTIVTDSRVILRYGIIEVAFTVYPYEFLNTGDTAITSFPITNNAGASKPLYKITGSGTGVLTVNSKTLNYTVDGNLYIDTRRLIAYKVDNGAKVNRSDKIGGNYDDLILKPGSNTISATVGTLEVTPRWGYAL